MAKPPNENKRTGKYCAVCDSQLYDSDTKQLKRRKMHFDITAVVAVRDYSKSSDICHPCTLRILSNGEIPE